MSETARTTSPDASPAVPDGGIARRVPNAPLMRPPISLVEAVNLVARAVTAKIRYHEQEIAALRAALRPFHEAASVSPQPQAANGLDADDAINQLLTLAGRISSNAPETR